MIRPPGFSGAAFGDAADGDGRHDPAVRAALAARHGIPLGWAWSRQVHGARVLPTAAPGPRGEGDALYTATRGLALAVATADCVPVVIEGPDVAAVVHAGWRGAAAGIGAAALAAIRAAGLHPERAALGPAIGPCCYEVGEEVRDRFPRHLARTRAGTPAVDLPAAVAEQMAGLAVWRSGRCTRCDESLHSHRRDGTARRQTAVAWLPPG